MAVPSNSYTLQGGCTTFSPADATTYYFGSTPGATPGNAGNSRLLIPKSGTIRAAYAFFVNATSNGTAETSAISLRLNNATDYEISAAVNNSATGSVANTALTIDVVAGDYVEFKWVTPTWVTNPVGTRVGGVIYIE